MKKICLLLLAGMVVASTVQAEILQQKFSNDPAVDGWKIYGDTNLFKWNSSSNVLDVTWDSSRTNSYFYHPLGVTYTKADSFCVVFDLKLKDVDAVGYFQIAAGLCNFTNSTSTNFSRANGYSPDLFEFNYFPDGPQSYGPSIDATLVDADSYFYFAYETSRMENDLTYHIVLIHQAGEAAISGVVFTNGQVFTKLPLFGAYGADDFKLDTLAICNYTTADDIYGDSLLVHGTVDNLAFASPLPVSAIRTTTAGTIQFAATTNWLYTLQRTTDFQTWTNVATAISPGQSNLILHDPSPLVGGASYRVNADLP
jgi:hypothetical protein